MASVSATAQVAQAQVAAQAWTEDQDAEMPALERIAEKLTYIERRSDKAGGSSSDLLRHLAQVIGEFRPKLAHNETAQLVSWLLDEKPTWLRAVLSLQDQTEAKAEAGWWVMLTLALRLMLKEAENMVLFSEMHYMSAEFNTQNACGVTEADSNLEFCLSNSLLSCVVTECGPQDRVESETFGVYINTQIRLAQNMLYKTTKLNQRLMAEKAVKIAEFPQRFSQLTEWRNWFPEDEAGAAEGAAN